MANRTYLFTREHGRSVQGETDVETLCDASYSIPLFWLSLFDVSSIITSIEHRDPSEERDPEDDYDFEYPYLVAPMEKALNRSRLRWPAMAGVIGEEHAALFNSWIGFLESHRAPYIHCETLELCWMDEDPESVGKGLRVGLTAFEQPAWMEAGFLWKKRRLTPAWSSLVSLAAIDNREPKNGIPPNGLCGYEGSFPVPWPVE
jgi:hypothetical protein